MDRPDRDTLPLLGFSISAKDPATAMRLPFLKGGPVDIKLQSPLTLIVGEKGCGKTTLLEALAARCAIRPSGGDSYRDYEDERPGPAASRAVSVKFSKKRPPTGWFMRADRLHVATSKEDLLRMGHADEWRRLDEQSRGESMLSLLAAEVDRASSELYILDEPDTGLSPSRQVALLRLLNEIVQSHAQAIVATHSVVLMARPEANLLYVDQTGIFPRRREDFDHWQVMASLMRNPQRFAHYALSED
jgi:predicted ATPase